MWDRVEVHPVALVVQVLQEVQDPLGVSEQQEHQVYQVLPEFLDPQVCRVQRVYKEQQDQLVTQVFLGARGLLVSLGAREFRDRRVYREQLDQWVHPACLGRRVQQEFLVRRGLQASLGRRVHRDPLEIPISTFATRMEPCVSPMGPLFSCPSMET